MDLRAIAEAYQSVYEGKEKECCKECGSYNHTTKEHDTAVTEAVDIASDYFLSEGIDEKELDVIIEDVGLDDFVEFVFEERSARKSSVRAKSYDQVKSEVDKSDAAKKKAGKGEYSAAYKKKETDVTDYGDDKPAKVSVKKVKKSVAKAKATKPAAKPAAKPVAKKAPAKKATKSGLGDKIRGALKKGVERHKAARAKGKEPEKRVKEFGKGFASGVKDTVKFAGKVKKAVVGETLLALLDTLEEGVEIDKFDAVLAYLIDEQIAEDFDAASKAMTSLSESLVDEIFKQQKKLIAWDEYSSRLVWEARGEGDPQDDAIAQMSGAGGDPQDDAIKQVVKAEKKAAKKKKVKEAYTVTAADKKGNTPAWQGYKSGKKGKDGTPLYKTADHLNKEGYQRNPEKGEAEERKRSKRVRGERTPMPPRGDKRREDFEKWYAANVR